MEKWVSGVYTVTCMPTGRRYVGSSGDIRERFFRHRYRLRHGQHHITAMQADWNEHGEAAFAFEVISLIAGRDERFDAEQAGIDEAMAAGLCYNPSPTARTPKGYRLTPGQRGALSAALQGHATSDETRRKIGESNKANWDRREITPEIRARMAEIGRKGKGKPKSAETRARMSAAQKGRTFTDESLAKMSAAHKGFTHTDEARRKIGAAAKGHPGYTAKLTADQAREIRRRAGEGERTSALAEEFGVSAATISDIKARRSWTNLA